MMPLPFLVLTLVWVFGWLFSSMEIIRFIKSCPEEDDPGFLLWDLEDQLPFLVAVLLVAWPFVCIRIALAVWGNRR